MSFKSDAEHYGSVAKFFHWFIFILVLALLTLGYTFDLVPKSEKANLVNIHKLIGLLLLATMLLRFAWAVIFPRPLSLSRYSWERIIEHIVHWSIYGILFLMPISGWIMATAAGKPPHLFHLFLPLPGVPVSKSLSNTAFEIHSTLAIILIILVILHILAALKHHFYDKNRVLKRMLPGQW